MNANRSNAAEYSTELPRNIGSQAAVTRETDVSAKTEDALSGERNANASENLKCNRKDDTRVRGKIGG